MQSALLEAMQERQVTIGDTTYPLPDPFLVLATQNPIEQEGTYQLPEAQLDRFMLKVHVGYPTREEERGILDAMATSSPQLDVHDMSWRRKTLFTPAVSVNSHLRGRPREGLYRQYRVGDPRSGAFTNSSSTA